MAFVAAAIGSIATTVGAFFAANQFTMFLGRILLSIAVSALQAALIGKPREPGIKTKVTQTGGTNPAAFPLLTYATAGTHMCPPMSHGSLGKTPNAFLTYVILLSDVPGATVNRLMINNQYMTIGTTPHPDYGLPVLEDIGGGTWIKIYTGSQTAADPMLMAKYGSYPERPWQADMIGRGLVYAILTFQYNRERYPSLPRVRFEMTGIPLYDPRKDSTVGGSGAHRWANKATWEATTNPIVGVYNTMRGITLDDGSVWGGGLPAGDLPLSSWFAGMNECDLLVSDGASGTEPQFRAGWEVSVDEEPADVIGELLKACTGQIADIGGQWKTRVGPPGIPVMNLTDADIVISRERNFRPFPNFAGSYNGVHATHPDPASAWQPKEAPPLYVPAYEAADGGQRLIADLNLVTVPYPAQVRRIMHASLEEERRFRRHNMTLPSDFGLLEPLDTLAWTSAENGYTAKSFEVSGLTEDLMSGHQQVMLREREAVDFSYPALPAPPAISILPVIPTAQTVPNFAVSGVSIPDAIGAPRRPALELTWEPDLADVTGILWEVRLQATGVVVARGSTQDVETGTLTVAEGLIASTAYEVRAKPVVDRPADWNSWLPATTPGTLITAPDLADGSVSTVMQTVALGPFASASLGAGAVLATLDIGAIGVGQGWERRLHFEARGGVSTGPNSLPLLVLRLQRRRASLGNPISDWSTIESFTVDQAAWEMFPDSGSLAGVYDDFEYRLMVGERNGTYSGDMVRNVYITAVRITK